MRLLRFAKKVIKHLKCFSEHKHASSLCSLMKNISRPVFVMNSTKRGEIIGGDVAAEMRVCEWVCERVCERVCEQASERALSLSLHRSPGSGSGPLWANRSADIKDPLIYYRHKNSLSTVEIDSRRGQDEETPVWFSGSAYEGTLQQMISFSHH